MMDIDLAKIARTLDEMRSREVIRETLHRYARGIDRRDKAEVERVFWPDSTVDFGVYKGTGLEFASMIVSWLHAGGVEITDHLLGNILIALEGDVAQSECYLHAYHRVRKEDGGTADCFIGARYQDRFERRDGIWRIAERVLVYDWFREYPESGNFSTGCLMGVSSSNATIGQAGPDISAALSRVLARLD
jgi:hypothetical protein